jgi:crossover junction endodeoxyribonuclease RuvC
MANRLIRIIGIDPGLRRTGWGLVGVEGSRLSYFGCGAVVADADVPMAERLAYILTQVSALVGEHAPDEAAIEETFINRDPQSALKLGQARGVAMAALAMKGLSVAEYSANVVKKTVVGAGHADKNQIAMMVKILLPASGAKSADAADALAVAICHAQHRTARLRGAA